MARLPITPIQLAAARVPNRVQHSGSFGTQNNAGRMRKLPPPVLLQAGPTLAREQTDDRQINQSQRNVFGTIQQAKGNPTANGNMIEQVEFVANTEQSIHHGLGIPARGAHVLNFSAHAGYRTRVNAAHPAEIYITCDADCTADVWAYG